MSNYGSTPGSGPGLKAVKTLQAKADDAKDVMKKNIKTVMEREEKLEKLELNAEYLKKGGASFEKGAQEMKTSLKWKVYKKWIILITLISIILLVIIGIIVAVVVTQFKK